MLRVQVLDRHPRLVCPHRLSTHAAWPRPAMLRFPSLAFHERKPDARALSFERDARQKQMDQSENDDEREKDARAKAQRQLGRGRRSVMRRGPASRPVDLQKSRARHNKLRRYARIEITAERSDILSPSDAHPAPRERSLPRGP